MRRRDFVKVIGASAGVWSLTAHAQQPAMPVIGFLGVTSAYEQRHWLAAFRQGLHETGFVEGENVFSTVGRKVDTIDCWNWRIALCRQA